MEVTLRESFTEEIYTLECIRDMNARLKETHRLATLAVTRALGGCLADRKLAPGYAKQAVVLARKFEERDYGPLSQLCENLLKALQSGAQEPELLDFLDEIGDRINYEEMRMEEAYTFLSEGVQ